MGLDSSSTPKVQKPIPPQGLQLAVCYSIINTGTHEKVYPGKPAVIANEVHYSWELPQLPLVQFSPEKPPQPMALFQEYTVSAGEKAKLPKMLQSWGSIKEPITAITAQLLKAYLGAACMINIEHAASKTQKDSKTGFPMMYANVGLKGLSVMPRMAAFPKPTGTINPMVFLDLANFDWNVYNAIPEYLQKKITESQEWAGILVKYPKPANLAQPVAQQQTQPVYQPSNQPVQPQYQLLQNGKMYDQNGMLAPAHMQPQNNIPENTAPISNGPAGGPQF